MASSDIATLYQFLHHAVEVMWSRGIRHAVLCPGSRSAPLALSVMRHGKMRYHIIDDERSAGYVALGLAQALHEGVVVVTTSGTAVLNLAPALAEAYYQEVPLLAWTADRPTDALLRAENQSIRQPNVFAPNVKASFCWDDGFFRAENQHRSLTLLAEALHAVLTTPRGSVHLNVPIAEPFYPTDTVPPIDDSMPIPPARGRVTHRLEYSEAYRYAQELGRTGRVLLLVGHRLPNYPFRKALKSATYRWGAPVLVDPVSNHYRGPHTFLIDDDFWMWAPPELLDTLRPDLLITFGYRFVSKRLRRFIAEHPPRLHWHVGPTPYAVDPFGVLTTSVAVHPPAFLEAVGHLLPTLPPAGRADYAEAWHTAYSDFYAHRRKGIPPLSPETQWFIRLMERLPERGILHLGNSGIVRHFQHLFPEVREKFAAWDVFSNRGTSGIDGSLSTAVGHARAEQRPVFAVVGDQSFFYDSNALWTDALPPHLHVIVINNHGGRIFEAIPGPPRQPELEEYFVRPHQRLVKELAEYWGMRYYRADSPETLDEVWPAFTASGASLLEIEVQ